MIVMHRQGRRAFRGLGDDLTPMDGARDALIEAGTSMDTARHSMLSPAAMRAMRSPATLAPINVTRERLQRALRTNVALEDSEASPECPCLVEKLQMHAAEIGSPLTDANLMQAQVMCARDSAAFQRVMVEGMGITLGFRDLDPCRPWYMRRTTWGIAAAIGVIGTLGLLVVRRRK